MGKNKIALVRLVNGEIEEASMVKGPAGFAVASFREEAPIETEIPNTLLLSAKPKEKPKAGSKKRPAAPLKRPAARRPAAVVAESNSSELKYANAAMSGYANAAAAAAAAPATARAATMACGGSTTSTTCTKCTSCAWF